MSIGLLYEGFMWFMGGLFVAIGLGFCLMVLGLIIISTLYCYSDSFNLKKFKRVRTGEFLKRKK